ncbi:MAG TPA: hypothetical protein PLN91_02995 [Rhodanobacteraceae bacterium]|nr:hypothetical protein [Rhodanobacteraceae bacterium]
MNTETTVETGDNALEQAAETTKPEADQPAQTEGEQAKAEGEEGAEKAGQEGEKPPKKEKTAEEKEIARLRRRVDNLTRRLYQSGANQPQDLQSGPIERTNQNQQADSEELRLSRAELQKLVDQRARELAPTLKQQTDEIEHRRTVVEKLSQSWGQEKFDQLASDLDDAFGGLADRSGKPKPATDAIFEAEDPAALIEYLADPEHSVEAEAIARMSPVQAGRAVAKLELKLAEERAKQKAEAKPKRSNAPAPVETGKAGGASNGMPDPSNTKAWIAWRNAQEGAR